MFHGLYVTSQPGRIVAWEHFVVHGLLPASIAVTAGVGMWRCARLLRYGRDARLTKLMWFYGLFAASLVAITIWTGQLSASIESAGHHDGNFTRHEGHAQFFGEERINVFLVAHHVLMLASLAVAVQAFGHKRTGTVAAAAGLAALSPFIPVALAAEAALTLYLAVTAILNHRERRSPGALQVAAGFLLFFIGHLSYFLLHQPGATRNPLGDILALVGIVLLVRLLPRPTA